MSFSQIDLSLFHLICRFGALEVRECVMGIFNVVEYKSSRQ